MSISKGPWHACHNGECSCKQIWCDDYPVAHVTSGEWGDEYPSIRLIGDSSLELKAEPYMKQITYGKVGEETARDNARLIAAAPDMLEALQQITSALQAYYGLEMLEETGYTLLVNAIKFSNDAINKAVGG